MVVKDKVGRKRYIAFTVDAQRLLKRHEMIRVINSSMPRNVSRDDVRLTAFNGEGGIVLCPHIKREDVCKALNGITRVEGKDAKVKTLVTSGTIKGAKTKLEKVIDAPL